jgi:quinol-cytochrome oxidoreductase complex cytochrome b subunit
MSASFDGSNKVPVSSGPGRFPIKPQTPLGWWGLVMTMISIAAWFVLPLITMTYRETYPITDTWVMPVIGMVLIDAAAVLNILAVWRQRERSIPVIIALCLTVPAATFFTLIVVGEGLSGV